jgi:hypothetical protein
MIDFSNMEIIEGGDGHTTIIFDLSEETLRELQNALQVDYSSPLFSERFQIFFEDAIRHYLDNSGVKDV